MKPATIYNCKACRDSGYVRSASGPLEPCPNCRWGAVALAKSQSWNKPAAGTPEPTHTVVNSDAPLKPGKPPAQVGRRLKIILYYVGHPPTKRAGELSEAICGTQIARLKGR
jgi:hypothetical protein